MISWMQNNNKYLVITIWVATIAFIGAGFVGWGSVSFGSSADSVAKVGDIPISTTKYSFRYNNTYAQYSQKFGKKFDKKVAKELGLRKIVLQSLEREALLLNFAKENGIIATDKEVGLEIANFAQFKDKNGIFNKSFYDNFLRSRGFKAKDFEDILKDELIVGKVMKLLDVKPLTLERDAIKLTFNIADKIKYKIIKKDDINVTVSDDVLKSYWEKNKNKYLTKTKYSLNLLWTRAKDINITKDEIEKYYKENSFNYVDKDGKTKELKDAEELVKNDITLEKIKKQAAIDRSRFKKGKLSATENISVNDEYSKFNKEIWKSIKEAKEGDFLKPKAVKDAYVTINIKSIKKPLAMSYEEAKELVKKEYIAKIKAEKLNNLIKEALKNSKEFDLENKDYITLSKFTKLPGLDQQDSLKVSRELFASAKKVNSIMLNNGAIVYEVTEQKILENNDSLASLNKEINSIKSNELSGNLIKNLSTKYKTEVYIKEN